MTRSQQLLRKGLPAPSQRPCSLHDLLKYEFKAIRNLGNIVFSDLRVRRVTINLKRLEVRAAKKDPNMSLPLTHHNSGGPWPYNHNFEVPAG